MARMLCLCRVIAFSCILLASSVPAVRAAACSLCGSNAACHKSVGSSACACNCGYHGHPGNCTAGDPPLGVSDRLILPDSQMNASSSLNASMFGPSEGRLHGSRAWCARSNATDEYLQVDLQFPSILVRIATQGFPNVTPSASAGFVKSYKLRTSLDGKTWSNYTSENSSQTEKVFPGNTDGNSVVCHMFNNSLIARHVRLYPQSSHGRPCLRFELYGGNGKCDNQTNQCPANASCINTHGGHTCSCVRGFFWDGVNCTDKNECELGVDKCPQSATCINTAGSYTCACGNSSHWNGTNCTCATGYRNNGTDCEDIDECRGDGQSICSASARCLNTAGSYDCMCKEGFTGDGFNCSALDACSRIRCHSNALCTDTDGVAECRCRVGFHGDGVHACVEGFECGTFRCHQNATCVNSSGSHTCRCDEGFSGNGTACADVDECSGTNDCHENAHCHNTDGSYRCTCRQDYVGSGHYCRKDETPEQESNSSTAVSQQHKVALISSVVVVGVALVCAAVFVCWRKRRVRKNARHSVTTIGQVDQTDVDLSGWRDSASIRSSCYSIPSAHPFSLSLSNLGAHNAQPLRTKGDGGRTS